MCTGSPKLSQDFDEKAYSNVLKLFDICLELPSDSEKYFGIVVDEFSNGDVCDTWNYL